MHQFEKKYQVWVQESDGPVFYRMQEFDSLMECMSAPKSGIWYITKAVNLTVLDADERSAVPHFPHHEPGQRSPADEEQQNPALNAYLGGSTGAVS